MTETAAGMRNDLRNDPCNAVHDPAALAELRRRLLSFARRELGDSATAEDVTQETLLALWQAPERYRGDAPFAAYAISVLKNKIVDVYRARGRETAVEDETLELLTENLPLNEATPDAADALDDKRFRAGFWPRLRTCIDDLPARTRTAFWMHDVLGLDVGAVGRHLGITTNHASVMSHRARAHVKRRWQALQAAAA
jgi:RNA polymerase sigma-70 factor (ECF subfamily)